MNTKIIVALVIAFAVVGLTGAASASLYDDYMARIGGSYAHTSIDYTSPIESISVDYYGTHTCDFSASGITTHTDITIYESPSIFDSYDFGSYTSSSSLLDSYAPSYAPSYTPSYTSGPSIFDSYVPTYSFWP